MSGPDIRSKRQTTCVWCGGPLPSKRQPDAIYCSGTCRSRAWRENAHVGRVSSVRRLKDGRISVVVHLAGDAGLRPGYEVRVGLAAE